MSRVLERIDDGVGTLADVGLVENVANQMQGRTLCPLGDFSTSPVLGSVKIFREEYERHIKEHGCWAKK